MIVNQNTRYPLYNPEAYHDACGIGFIVENSGQPSRRTVTYAIKALKRLRHRGATGADSKTGDGAGILTDIPLRFFAEIIKRDLGYSLKKDEDLVIGMVFTNAREEVAAEKTIRANSDSFNMTYIGKRTVPINIDALGDTAQASCPIILQFFLSSNSEASRSTEVRAYLLRKTIEKQISATNGESFICSFSSRTIVYKGLLAGDYLEHFYPDLADPKFIATTAMFHERFSTNTNPIWSMAQPHRFIAHNGEINTIKGNRLWMQAREKELQSDFWEADLELLKPIVENTGSDSFSLDNCVEFLTRSGRSIFHNLMMLIPEPYVRNPNISAALRDFYIYHENFLEPWDGPAALVFSDGQYIGAKMDRNGLRPLRYTITKDGLVIVASEAGVVDVHPDNLLMHHHMESGEIFAVALNGDGILSNDILKKRVSKTAPYSELLQNNFTKIKRGDARTEFGDFLLPKEGFDKRLRITLGWDKEDFEHFVIPMAKSGREAVGSMGDDTPPAVLSRKDRKIYDYFKQSFAQVTNPPIDPIREKFVTSLFKYLGSETNLLAAEPEFNGAIRIEGPVLSPREVKILMDNHHWFPHTKIHCHIPLNTNFKKRLEDIKIAGEKAIQSGIKIIFLSDENLTSKVLPIPMALMVSTLHHHLIAKKIRSQASLICLTGEVVEDHHVAMLIGLGASAVYPYMAYELIREHFDSENWTEKMSNYRYALEKGLMKIMAKMGISTLSSYHGSMLFHAIGLSSKLLNDYFPFIHCDTGGIDLPQIIEWMQDRNLRAYSQGTPRFEDKGRFRYRKKGEIHGFSPVAFQTIQHLARTAQGESGITKTNSEPIYLRDFLEIKKSSGVPIKQVEEVGEILKRFGTGAMSFGALSEEAHRALAVGMNLVGGRSNSGEGGEQTDRYAPGNPDKSANCHTKQVASGRFGVTTDYLAAAREIQIKIAQGAKPGEGGQLPGHKVTLQIASTRSATVGIPLISPPPHHDIYSIEDLAQLIYDLNQVAPRAAISVKLVAQPGVGTVAAGVVKAGADIVHISGGDGGTGAAPLGSVKHTGYSWELGLAETHQTLTAEGLRSRVILRVDGGLKTARDIIIAALLGAEEYDFGTAALIALGCVMARRCHLNTCPAGIATQDEKLRKKFKGSPQDLANYMTRIANDVLQILTDMGFYSLADIIGRSDLLYENPVYQNLLRKKGISLYAILNPEAKNGLFIDSKIKFKPRVVRRKVTLDEEIIEETRIDVMTHGHAVVHKLVQNTDRAIGARLSGELAFLYGRGNFSGNIQCRLTGVAGQSFGAFLTEGVELRLRGIANDYVGKGMSGGLITIRLEKKLREHLGSQTVIGNTALYGATGGMLLIAGRCGERFAVRNSGAAAVVEGVGDNGCEYMTRGTVLVLGKFGQNFGAGMTGGVVLVYCRKESELENLNREFVRPTELLKNDESLVLRLLRLHKFHTGSVIANKILKNWKTEKNNLYKIIPLATDIIDFDEIYNQQIADRMGILLNE